MHLRFRWIVHVVLAAGLLGGCSGKQATPQSPAGAVPADHYRAFDDGEALAAYLRAGSDAGPLVGAHRGGPAPGYPENAIATFQRSLRHGPVLLECDVRLSRDSVLVLMHDETLGRTTTGAGDVSRHTLAQLRTLRLVDNQGQETPFRIPTLQEAMAWAEERAVLELDVKDGVPPEQVVTAIRRAGAFDRIVVLTYSTRDAEIYQTRAPSLVVSAPAESVDAAQDLLQQLDRTRLIAFAGVGTLRPEIVDVLRGAGVRVTVGTFGEWDEQAVSEGPDVYRRLIDRGVGILATDRPAIAVRATQMRRHSSEGAPDPKLQE